MIEFAWQWILVLLPLPWVLRWLLPASRRSEGAALKVPFYHDLNVPQQVQAPQKQSALILILLWIVWMLLLLAAARPQWLGQAQEYPISGRDIMLAVDISGSMETGDFLSNGRTATRMDVVKETAGVYIERRQGDRLGLILFGSRAYLQTPLTFDLKTVKYMLYDAETKLAGDKTAIGDAIGIALKRFQEYGNEQKILILLTDGYNTAGAIDPRQAAKLAKISGLKIYTVGIGADRIRRQDLFGTRIVNASRSLDEKLLKDIAAGTGGVYFRAKNTHGLQQIYSELDTLEPLGKDTETLRPVSSLFYWPLGLALILSACMVAGFFISKLVPPRMGEIT